MRMAESRTQDALRILSAICGNYTVPCPWVSNHPASLGDQINRRASAPCSRRTGVPSSRRLGASAHQGGIIAQPMPIRDNETWIADLREAGPARDAALSDLRGVIQHGLPFALSRWVSPDDPLFAPLVEEVTQDTLIRVLEQLETFEGRSMFTTWVQKIAVRIALTELRRKRWHDTSLDELLETEGSPAPSRLMADRTPGPDAISEQSDMISHVRRILEQELTPKQREALVLLGIQEVPLEEAARRMKTNRNALYKLLHDARLRLKRRLKSEGLTAQEVLAAFARK